MCQRGQGVVRQMFETFDDPTLRGFVVWLPMLEGDNVETARERASLFQDRRVALGWDPQRRIGDGFGRMLGLRGTSWDVYLLYPAGARWDDADPPVPDFWMHQLPEIVGAPAALRLDAATLERELRGLLADVG